MENPLLTDTQFRAFPSLQDDDGVFNLGMELRDYFAAKAMQGLLSNPNVVVADSQLGWSLCNTSFDGMAATAYEMADAQIRQRKK